MVYSNGPFYTSCNREELFMTGFVVGCTFFALTCHFVRELCIFFKQKEALLRRDYELKEESSESESSEQLLGEDRMKEHFVNVPVENDKKSTQNEINTEKSCEVSSREECLNPRHKPPEPQFYCEEIPKTPSFISQVNSDENATYIRRSSGRYMTNNEMEEVAENFRKERPKQDETEQTKREIEASSLNYSRVALNY
jgi:hypothetical protein